TPFLLSKVKEITGGDSLESNIMLVYNNALLGSKIAVELEKIS
ncbi:MAG TPA: pseudouridine-5'-phosphate glycosidase, partial [Sedimentibacter sp.]|nr:pseudouridine-5'-phosphate glycosidase [Sedimentibacter sp.]